MPVYYWSNGTWPTAWPNSWNTTVASNVTSAYFVRLPGPLWPDLLARDRWHLLNARPPSLSVYRDAVERVLTRRPIRPFRLALKSRHERNPLNKRALARR